MVTRETRPPLANASQATVSTPIGSKFFLPTKGNDIKISPIMHAREHDFKIGGEIDRVRICQEFGYNQLGHFRLLSSDPDRILDIVTSGGRIANRFDAPPLFFRQIETPEALQRVSHVAL